jgi:hypothetical protein
MIYLSLFIVPWSYFLYIFKYILLLVFCNHQWSAIMLPLKVWLLFCLNWNQHVNSSINIRYFEIPQHRTGSSTSYSWLFKPFPESKIELTNVVAGSSCQEWSIKLKWEDTKIDNHSNDKLKVNLVIRSRCHYVWLWSVQICCRSQWYSSLVSDSFKSATFTNFS